MFPQNSTLSLALRESPPETQRALNQVLSQDKPQDAKVIRSTADPGGSGNARVTLEINGKTVQLITQQPLQSGNLLKISLTSDGKILLQQTPVAASTTTATPANPPIPTAASPQTSSPQQTPAQQQTLSQSQTQAKVAAQVISLKASSELIPINKGTSTEGTVIKSTPLTPAATTSSSANPNTSVSATYSRPIPGNIATQTGIPTTPSPTPQPASAAAQPQVSVTTAATVTTTVAQRSTATAPAALQTNAGSSGSSITPSNTTIQTSTPQTGTVSTQSALTSSSTATTPVAPPSASPPQTTPTQPNPIPAQLAPLSQGTPSPQAPATPPATPSAITPTPVVTTNSATITSTTATALPTTSQTPAPALSTRLPQGTPSSQASATPSATTPTPVVKTNTTTTTSTTATTPPTTSQTLAPTPVAQQSATSTSFNIDIRLASGQSTTLQANIALQPNTPLLISRNAVGEISAHIQPLPTNTDGVQREHAAIQEALRNALPNQQPVGDVLTQMQSAAAQTQTAKPEVSGLVRSMLQLFGVRPGTPEAPQTLQRNVQSGGMQTEFNLASGKPPQKNDLKGLLRQLQQASTDLPIEQRQRMEQLIQNMQSRITHNQVSSLQQWKEAPDGSFERVIQLDIPIFSNNRTDNLELRISQEHSGQGDHELATLWRARLHFDLEEFGAVDAEIKLTGEEQIQVQFWCDEKTTQRHILKQLQDFGQMLQDKGFDEPELNCYHGHSPDHKGELIQKHLVDIHT